MLILSLLQSSPLYAIGFLLSLIVALTVHEFAHAWTATKFGDPTAKYEGRLTLNPLAHLDPMGTIFLLLVGFGWGKPVPVNPNYFRNKSDHIWVSLAGIITNLAIALVFAGIVKLSLASGGSIIDSPLLVLASLMVVYNLILAVFNILPIPPLDGSYLVEYFLSDEAKIQYQFVGPYLLFGIIIADRLVGTSIIFSIIAPVIKFLAGSDIYNFFFR